VGGLVLTISKLKRWSINYYNDTAQAAGQAANDLRRANGGLGEYYSEHETRTPVWLVAGDKAAAARLVGLRDVQRAGGEADIEVVTRWLDDGIAPNGVSGRAFGKQSVHGFDLTFAAPKSVSLIRALRADDVAQKAFADAHETAIGEAMEYLAAHAGYTRVHNPGTGEKDLVRLPGAVAIAYQHETSRCGDPHLHTHVIVPNRQARADGALVSIDGTSLYHEAKAAGVIYQATLRRELNRLLGFEWAAVDPWTGMAEIAGISAESIRAWSQRSSQLRAWAANNLTLVDGEKPSPAQLATAQKATRPTKPEELAWARLQQMWRADARGLALDRDAHFAARAVRTGTARAPFERRALAEMASRIDKAAFTRADLVELLAAQLPVDTAQSPRRLIEESVDTVGIRLTRPRLAHEREGHEKYTLDLILAEEFDVLRMCDARDVRAVLRVQQPHTAGLSADQARVLRNIAESPWLVQPLAAPAGAGKTTSMRALRAAAHDSYNRRVVVLAPTGQAVDVAVRGGAGDEGRTIAKALKDLRDGKLSLSVKTLVVVDEAAMVGTNDLRELLAATTAAGVKTVLVGDAHQLAPVKARGGMFAQLCSDLPWAQRLSEVWRMRDPEERAASLALRDGGPAPLRRGVEWYRTHGRLHTGDAVTMAQDALTAYAADVKAGKDALLVCDTVEMCDALNRRIHGARIPADAPTVTAARGHRIAEGDLVISRRNDSTVPVWEADRPVPAADSVRNGNRWRVVAVDTQHYRIAARRVGDGVGAVFSGDYLREHITHGYAVTVHTAQGVTTETTHAVLGETSTRAMIYVAMTRGRDGNAAYLYERAAEHERGREQTGVHVMQRGTSRHAAQLARSIIAGDDRPLTAHDMAARALGAHLPERVRLLVERRAAAVSRRRVAHSDWESAALSLARDQGRDHHISVDRGIDHGIDL
jgi:conjugative relaxase-like TrwC/TraI family protein